MGPQYTTCVEEKDFSGGPNLAYIALLLAVTAVGIQLALLTAGLAGWVAGAAFLELIRYFLNYLVHGKLICLHRQSNPDCLCGGPSGMTVCAIGEIVDTEDVGQDKNFLQDIDDDYAINLVLFPFDMAEFAAKGFVKKDEILKEPILGTALTSRAYSDKFRAYLQSLMAIATEPTRPQADLLTRRVSVHGKVPDFGYLRDMVMLNNGDYLPWTDVVGRDPGLPEGGPDENERWVDFIEKNAQFGPERFQVPVLHCEFEGSRPNDMLAALEGFPFGSSFCKKNFITKFICKVVSAALAPIALAAVLLAWAQHTKGSSAPANVDGKPIGPKERVIVRGSWVYDTGHAGWNEIHAVRIVQHVENVPPDPNQFKDFLHTWCDRLAETPTGDGLTVPVGVVKPEDVPAAELTLIAQRRPENQWEFHPSVDGCQPGDQPQPGLPPIH